jgi:uncharacterized membrane protein
MPLNPHPLVVHFPIALLMASVLFDLSAFLSKREALEKAARWNLIMGLVTAAMAFVTGLQAEESVPPFPVMQEIVERHEKLAYITLGIFVLLFLWRVLKHGKFFRRWPSLYLLVAFLGMLNLAVTAYYGGELVYKYGVGVQAPPSWNEQKRENP